MIGNTSTAAGAGTGALVINLTPAGLGAGLLAVPAPAAQAAPAGARADSAAGADLAALSGAEQDLIGAVIRQIIPAAHGAAAAWCRPATPGVP